MIELEDQVDKMKMENCALSDTLSKNAADLLRTDEQIQHLNLELTISQEKHRTCQQEVTVRDSNLLKLQTELDKVQQHYTGVLDEMNIREGEEQRLNAKIRQLHSDVN